MNSNSDTFSFYKTVTRLAGANVAALAISSLASIFLTRALGAEGRGIIAWIMSLAVILNALTQVGMTHVNRRFVAEDNSRAGDLVLTTIIVCSIAAIIFVSAFMFYGFSQPLGQANKSALMTGLLLAPIWAITECLGDMLLGLHKPKQYNFVILLQKIFNAALIAIIVITGYATPLIAISALAFSFILKFLFVAKSLHNNIDLTFHKEGVKWVFKHLKSFIYTNYASSVMLLCSNAIIPILLVKNGMVIEAGLYSAAMIIIDAVYNVSRKLGMYAVPKLVSTKNIKQRNKLKINILLVNFAALVSASLFFYFTASWLIPFLFGKDFIDAVRVFQILAIGMTFVSVYYTLYSIISSEAKGLIIIIAPAILLLSNFSIASYLIPDNGAVGGAIAWASANLIACIVAMIISVIVAKKVKL